MDPDWQVTSLASRRTWLSEVHPVRYNEDLPGFVWGEDCDSSVAQLRAANEGVNALFVVAETGGIAFTPVWPGNAGELHPLMEIASSTDDTNWIVVCRANSDGDFAVDLILDDPPRGYSPLVGCERHDTPQWTIRITSHS